VRPLLDDGAGDASAVTRDYRLALESGEGAPILTVWGGKLTTYRKLSEEAGTQVSEALGETRPAWTRHGILPGGDLDTVIGPGRQTQDDFERFVAEMCERFAAFEPALVRRWCRAYGTRCLAWLADARSPSDLGEEVVPGLHEAELRYLSTAEWARSAEDVLWRRSKLGLHCNPSQRDALTRWFARQPAPPVEEIA
jgi:glycerol-3-phosphate dehydrogenase